MYPAMILPRSELGGFVRAMRERAAPPSGDGHARRRTAGLRREELAASAGISVTWLTWIEQGRTVAVSALALARLSGALSLSRAERAYLFALAGRADPHPAAAGQADLPETLLACLRAIDGPAYLLDDLCEARGWNGAAEALFCGWLDRPDQAGGHNLLRFLFQNPDARRLVADWPERSHRVVAEFRADAAGRLHEPPVRRLLDDLAAASPAFRAAWAARGVQGREGGARRFQHPRQGEIHLDQLAFAAIGWPGLKLVVLIAATAATEA